MGKTMIWEGIRGEIREIDKDKYKTRQRLDKDKAKTKS